MNEKINAPELPIKKKTISEFEFVALMAAIMSITAISIDAMLPALTTMTSDLGISNPNDIQLVISLIFIGMAVGQLLFGPLADSIGRKPSMLIGAGLFTIGSIITVFTDSFFLLLVGRVIQGIGLGAPRTVTIAIIRDKFSSWKMARILSNCYTVLILAPMVAPLLGQLVMNISGSWRAIFGFILLFGAVIIVWFYLRQEETLAPKKRIPFSFSSYINAIIKVCKMPIILAYSVATGFIFAILIAYLSASAQIFQVQYQSGDNFVYIFALTALTLGIASNLNGRWVERFGMEPIIYSACALTLLNSALFIFYILFLEQQPDLVWTILYISLMMFAQGGIFGNINALAMEPLDEETGTGATVIGVISTLISVPTAIFIAKQVTDSVLPLVVGIFSCTLLTVFILMLIKFVLVKQTKTR